MRMQAANGPPAYADPGTTLPHAEPDKGCFIDDCPLQRAPFQVPCQFGGVKSSGGSLFGLVTCTGHVGI